MLLTIDLQCNEELPLKCFQAFITRLGYRELYKAVQSGENVITTKSLTLCRPIKSHECVELLGPCCVVFSGKVTDVPALLQCT